MAVLTGRLRDETGDRLTPTHTKKGARVYRYYVSHRSLQPAADGKAAGWRLPARDLERVVTEAVASHLEEAAARGALLVDPRADEAERVALAVTAFASNLRASGGRDLRTILEAGAVAPGRMQLRLARDALAEAIAVDRPRLAETLLSIDRPFALRRRGVELKLVAGTTGPRPDPVLVAALARAHRWADLIQAGTPLNTIAGQEHTSESFVRTRARLAFLSPAIQRAILRGDQPVNLSLERLVRVDISLDWREQEQRFGFRE